MTPIAAAVSPVTSARRGAGKILRSRRIAGLLWCSDCPCGAASTPVQGIGRHPVERPLAHRIAACRCARAPVTASNAQLEKMMRRAGRSGPGATPNGNGALDGDRSEEHTSELQSLMRLSYAVV